MVSSLSLVTTDIQLAVMKTRMLPIAKVFNKFPRMIRDLSRELNKQIDLEITGEEIELDGPGQPLGARGQGLPFDPRGVQELRGRSGGSGTL